VTVITHLVENGQRCQILAASCDNFSNPISQKRWHSADYQPYF